MENKGKKARSSGSIWLLQCGMALKVRIALAAQDLLLMGKVLRQGLPQTV
jgi:hypothetical protein